ncbi:MAG: type IV pilus twitching motility protein PilT [Candidatus Eiseniibacteriota bacterium]
MDIREVLEAMTGAKASDLHVKVGTAPLIRVDGELYALGNPPPSAQDLEVVVDSLLTPAQRAKFDAEKEIDFAFGLPGLGRFRCNIFHQRGTIAIAIRTIPISIPTLEDLGLPEVIHRFALLSRGLVLVTGATGSGKSTTLASLIDQANREINRNVITIEDPIEFLHRDKMSAIHQREVGVDVHSFAEGLRRILRQDPDIILVGEIRDRETMETVLMAADTGHLVFSTLHTTDAAMTMQRVLSFFEPHQQEETRHSLAANLQAVVSQRLIPRRGGSGRIPAVEILINTPTIKEMLQLNKPLENLRSIIEEGVTQYGMQTFDQSLMRLLKDQHITEEEALKACTNPNEFELHLRGINSSSDRTWAAVEQGSLPGASRPAGYGVTSGEPPRQAAPAGPAGRGTLPDWMTKD